MKYILILCCLAFISISSKSQVFVRHDSISRVELADSLQGPVQTESFFTGGENMWNRHLTM